ncbi:hypothetical protein PQ744_07755 [Thermoanaerobacterium thermosaccharolyticum]|nr:hypothetical protein [Thermoanaerobacterium thermosaccharolyticum]
MNSKLKILTLSIMMFMSLVILFYIHPLEDPPALTLNNSIVCNG